MSKESRTVMQEYWRCDGCGYEHHYGFELYNCTGCGRPVCSSCGASYEFKFIVWKPIDGGGRLGSGLRLRPHIPLPYNFKSEHPSNDYYCTECANKIDVGLQAIGFINKER